MRFNPRQRKLPNMFTSSDPNKPKRKRVHVPPPFPTKADPNPVFLIIGEAAELARVSKTTVRGWIRQGRIKAHQPGRRTLINRAELLALICGEHYKWIDTSAPIAPLPDAWVAALTTAKPSVRKARTP